MDVQRVLNRPVYTLHTIYNSDMEFDEIDGYIIYNSCYNYKIDKMFNVKKVSK